MGTSIKSHFSDGRPQVLGEFLDLLTEDEIVPGHVPE